MGNPDYNPTELTTAVAVAPEPIAAGDDGPVGPNAIVAGPDAPVMYRLNIASPRGDDEKTMTLDDTVDYIMERYRTQSMMIYIDGVMYYPEARFTNTAEDNRIVEQDRHRLRNYILSKTTLIKNQLPVVPDIHVCGKIKGGGVVDETGNMTSAAATMSPPLLSTDVALRIASHIADYDGVAGDEREPRIQTLVQLILFQANGTLPQY